jgi:putative ABC transport system permease protein
VGVRKVIGAEKSQIVFQFLSEAMLLSTISALLGLVLAYGLLPWFNRLAGRQLHFSLTEYPQLLAGLIGIVFLAGILAGSYPALVLARFRPVEVLKNKIRIGGSNFFTRTLVTFQFALSIGLIGCTIVILQQTKFLLNRNPGFDKENIIAVDASQTDPDKTFPLFRHSLVNYPEINGITSAGAGMGKGKGLLGYSDHGLNADINIVDTNYMKVLGMHLLAGTNVQPASMNDSLRPIVINETFMRALGWKLSNAVGQTIPNFQGSTAVVKGVVKNFNYEPLGKPVFNQVFFCTGERGYINFYVAIRPGNPARALSLLQKAWHDAAPAVPLKYSFLDEDINAFYQNEQTWTGIVASAGGMSILLACLGLLGLASLAAINRRKEIGIRKVLGASVRQVVVLLSKDFLQLVALAFLIASPVTWYLMHEWLQGYAIRIELQSSVLLLAGAVAILTAIMAVAFQALRSANANPVHSLRSE